MLTGAPTVLIGDQPAARAGDMASCVGPIDVIQEGSASVLICGQPAARIGDKTAHGGALMSGCTTVLIGDDDGGASAGLPAPILARLIDAQIGCGSAQAKTLAAARKHHTPLARVGCNRARSREGATPS